MKAIVFTFLLFPIDRDKDRDISEKIALGLAKPTASQEMMYDQRLFNKSQGLSTNMGDDECWFFFSCISSFVEPFH